MKTFFSQNRILFWVLIFLLILNIAAIGSIIYYRNKVQSTVTDLPRPVPHMRKMHPEGRFMQEFLELDEKQSEQFRNARHSFHTKANEIAVKLREKRMEMFDELKTANPDKKKLQRIADEIGNLHAEINAETGDYYLNVRELCNHYQREKLHQFFIRTFDNREQINTYRHGHRRGKRNLRNFEVE